jgi:hypothetical protein
VVDKTVHLQNAVAEVLAIPADTIDEFFHTCLRFM